MSWQLNLRKTFKYLLFYGLIVNLLLLVLTCPVCLDNWQRGAEHMVIGMTYTFLLFYGCSYIQDRLLRRFSWLKEPVLLFALSFFLTILYTCAIVVVVNFSFELGYLGRTPNQFWSTLSAGSFIFTSIFTLLISGIIHAGNFLHFWKEAAIAQERYKREALTSKFENLKNQISPHFLFNSLNVLESLVHEDPKQASQFIRQLGNAYRHLLQTGELDLVPLEQELNGLDSYLYLLQIRFGDSLKIRQNLSRDASILVPPFALQMLIENAVKHNVASRAQPLEIELFRENDYLCVRNNLHLKSTPVGDSSGIGLENIRERYRHLSGKVVIVDNGPPFFTVKIPVIEND